MKASQKLMLAALLVLVSVAVAGMLLTSGTANNGSKRPVGGPDVSHLMNQNVLATAHRLAALASTPQERTLAENGVRLADRDVDMAFADALQRTSEQPVPSTKKVTAQEARIAQLQSAVQHDSRELKVLNEESAHARGARLGYLQGRIELAQAELALDKDELGDARQDLTIAGGGTYKQLEKLWKQHEARQHEKEEGKPSPSSSSPAVKGSSRKGLIAGWQEWSALRGKQARLNAGAAQVAHVMQRLTEKHQKLAQLIQQEETRKEALAQKANAILNSRKLEKGANPQKEATTALSLLHELSLNEKSLTSLKNRIADLQQLDANYSQWIGLVQNQERAALHRMILYVLWIIVAGLLVFLMDRAIDRALVRVRLERKQRATLQTVLHFTLKAVTVLVVLLVIFGPPNNMSTIVGLAGAGLTVSLKDFIVSFFGWFILMSRHGIRNGDWVEVNGVSGEVIDVTLFRTVLLETGNWNEPGHPTGRTVSFLNLFAVEGHYFNFTTSGQWLWDEIKLVIPWDVNPYPIIEKIEERVKTETQNTLKRAEQEWQRATRGYTVKSFTAAPNINLRTLEDGVEVTVQYITSAIDRFQLRLKLSRAAVGLIHEGKAGASATESAEEYPAVSVAKARALPEPEV